MSHPTVETIARVPWSAELPRTTIELPQRGDVAGVEVRSAPALPRVRVTGAGQVALLNFTDVGFTPAGTIAWTTPGATTWHHAADPFANVTVTGVDFWTDPAGTLVVLARTGGSDGARARVARIDAAGTARSYDLDGPYERIVADDRDRVYLVRHAGGGALVPFDPMTGALGTPREIGPGSTLALAANRAAVVSARVLDATGPTKVTAAAGLPQALVFLFGVDAQSNYYTAVDGELAKVAFDGRVLARVSLGAIGGLQPAPAASSALQPRLAAPATWQVDSDGRIVIARADGDGVELLRLTLPR